MDLDIGSGRQEVFAVGNKSVSGKEGKSMSLMGLWINLFHFYMSCLVFIVNLGRGSLS